MSNSTHLQTVLVVDDTPENLAILSSLLRGNYQTKIAINGANALEIAASEVGRPDLILLDITMPDMDGFEVCRRLKEDEATRDIPVIFLSALNETVDKMKAFGVGGIDYITKPFQAEEVQARVETHLKVRRLQVELEKKNETLEAYNQQLNELSALKDEFLKIASHDLKNPLTCILGFASIIGSTTPAGTVMKADTHSWLEKIRLQCLVMQKIIEDFLEFQAMEDGQVKLAREKTDLNALATSVLERNAGYAEKKSVTCTLDLQQPLPLVVGDNDRINQVLDNFVGNAIKFSPTDQTVTVCTRSNGSNVTLEVTDTGPGLTEEDFSKLFVRYAKLSNKPTGGEKSSGLGLAICKKIIEMHGGEIGACNNPEAGSTFWFKLPILE
ncbi:MAG: hybrid sensor histidine kinase/response regulator [Candidatus Sumerlaeaceae bacterium]